MAYAYNKTHLQLCHCLCLEMILSISYKALVAVLERVQDWLYIYIYTKIKTPILIRKLARNMFIDTKIGLNDVLISFLLFRNKLNYFIISYLFNIL